MSEEPQEIPQPGDDCLPVLNISRRRDGDWEHKSDPRRVAVTLAWAQPLQARIQALGHLGDTLDNNPEYERLVDELYDGLRNRLTRQDLLWIALTHLAERIGNGSVALVEGMGEELEDLDSEYGFERHFGSAS